MTLVLGWVFTLLLNPPHEAEISERMTPSWFQGSNYWGPEATRARHDGKIPPIVATAHMATWDRWGRKSFATVTSCSGWAMPGSGAATSR